MQPESEGPSTPAAPKQEEDDIFANAPKWEPTPPPESEKAEAAAEFERTRVLAEQGDVEAQRSLAYKYIIGEGVPKNPVLAWQWYRRAADSGDVLIQYLVGSSYLYGDEHLGVIMDRAEAAKWYRRAAAQGEKSVGLGQRDLFRLYERKAGGVPKDDVLAYMWYNLAAAKEGGRVSVSPRRPFIGTPRLTRDSGSRSPRRGNWACGIQSLGGGRETSPNNVSQHSEA